MYYILTRRRSVMAHFNTQNGYEADCDVIYGDTDSVMVDFRVRQSHLELWDLVSFPVGCPERRAAIFPWTQHRCLVLLPLMSVDEWCHLMRDPT